jgi:predicted ATPase/DNA-binding winged helix-turn-helix (wHTH) protein
MTIPAAQAEVSTGRHELDVEPVVSFGPCRVLPRSRRLWVDDEPVELGGRAFDLLLALIATPGTIVAREQIYDRVWPDTVVGDANLRVQIGLLRKAFGNGRDLLQTIPGRGYLLAGVKSAAGEAVPAPPSPVPSVSMPPTNLPRPAQPMIGRAGELAQLESFLLRRRLVTLVGAGGIGKTRLAIEAGWQGHERFPGGVWRIDLGTTVDAANIPNGIAMALNIPLRGPAAIEPVAAAIGRQRMLLIFDGCEHLVDGVAPLIETLLAQCPEIAIVVTSQEALRIAAEQIVRLQPLALPPADVVEVGDFAAIQLFLDRVRSADRLFRLTATNGEQIAAICRRVAGVPLALEMAAAQVSTLGLAALDAVLAERLPTLGPGLDAPDEPGRHGTLRSLADWSHGLLEPAEQRIFRRLAVFSGPFSLEAAVTIVKDDGIGWWDAVDSIGTLIEKSLLAVEGGQPPRYRLLETLRASAAERLAESASGTGSPIAMPRFSRRCSMRRTRIGKPSSTRTGSAPIGRKWIRSGRRSIGC